MHHEALTDNGKEIFPKLSEFNDFYLAGGTALALQIGHRVSVDFDFFSDEKITKTLLPSVERLFEGRTVDVVVNHTDELGVRVSGVNITFLHYPFPLVYPLVEGELPLLSVPEIAVTKAYTIGRRGELKDYVDLYFCIKERHVSLEEVIDKAGEKYADAFNDRLFLEQLAYFDDLEETPLEFLKEPIGINELAAFFDREIRSLDV